MKLDYDIYLNGTRIYAIDVKERKKEGKKVKEKTNERKK